MTKRTAAFVCMIVLLTSSLLSCAYKPGAISNALNGNESGTIFFESIDNYDFVRNTEVENIVVEGDLLFPDIHNGGAYILSHGSGGWGDRHSRWAALLRVKGFATFGLDHFGPRNVLSTVHGQVRVTEQQMAADILRAAELLASDPRIDSDKIFHIGWSKGGTAGLLAAVESSAPNAISEISPIAGYIAFYPYCGFTGPIVSQSKILILHGSADDYAPPQPCRRLADEMKNRGTSIEMFEFAGAHHGFDNWNLDTRFRPSSITVRDATPKCTVVYSRVDLSRSADGQHSIESFAARKAFLQSCGERGVTIGGALKYRGEVESLVLNFADN